jgi:excisionase family DNA binding protein
MVERKEWTTQDLAEAAGVSTAHIRRLLIDGRELRGYKLGRDWRVRGSEARRWLSERGVSVERVDS